TPLIDVVFLLLIFFMVSTTFDRELELNVLLPEAAGEMSEQPREIELTIDKNGNYYIDQAQVVESNLRTLKRALEKAAEGRDDPVVIIRADAKAQHQSVIRAMD
ncbi:MAG: biopolymer transporter ExbD, partial [Anaerolineae bacterium]|nr:biopolymer transporter ExbD [Anaerolineae bacterium]